MFKRFSLIDLPLMIDFFCMDKSVIYFTFLLIILCTSYTEAHAQKSVLSENKWKEIDEYIKTEMQQRQIPGLALGIFHKGNMIKAAAYGLADVQNGGLVKPNTVFELASITKQFTASAIMVLVQEGKLSLDDEMNTYLTDAPERWKGIKIKHLLSHSSGLPVIGKGFTGYDSLNKKQLRQMTGSNTSADIAFAMVKTDTLSFKPGERYTYSDIGYFLLGLIIQNVSGISYREFMQKRIFDPAGLKDTYILDQITIHPNEARGYSLRDGKLVNIRRTRQWEVPSHYGIFSNLQDMAKWDSILYTEKILTNNSKEIMWAPTLHNTGNKYPYGFAWSTWTNNGKRIIDHTGITGTQITRLLNDSITIVVLTNLGTGAGAAADSWGIGPQVANMMGLNPFITDKHITANGGKVVKGNVENLKALAGTYSVGNSTRKLYLENEQLVYERGKNKNRLVPLSDNHYLVTGILDELVLEVLPEEKGKPEKLKWYLNGQTNVVMERTTDNK